MYVQDCSNIGLGKMSQNDIRPVTEFCSHWMQISNIKYDERYDLVSVIPITRHFAEVKYVPKASKIRIHKNVQPVIYAFNTAYARVRMLTDMLALQKMGANILYTDTG